MQNTPSVSKEVQFLSLCLSSKTSQCGGDADTVGGKTRSFESSEENMESDAVSRLYKLRDATGNTTRNKRCML